MFGTGATQLLVGFVFAAIGFVAFRYGRKMELLPPVVIGLVLMTYSMFVSDVVWLTVIGVGLTGALWLFRE
jgi:hypothetical protein